MGEGQHEPDNVTHLPPMIAPGTVTATLEALEEIKVNYYHLIAVVGT